MPARRKRTTAKSAKTKRAKPKLPEGNFDTSITEEERENKLQNYIEDYQLQGKREKMRKYIQTMKGLVANCYKSAMIELLKSVREMTMEEFMRKGGTVDTVVNAQVHATITGLVTNSSALSVSTTGRLPLANVSNSIDIAGLSLDQSSMISQISSNVQTAGKSTRKKKQVRTDMKPPPVTGTRSSRRLQAKSSAINNEVTPMPNMSTLSVLNQQMLVTPKFDPRLPIPPRAMREPKAGERIISMDGSPITNHVGPNVCSALQVTIPLTGGKTMQLGADDRDQDIDVANDSVAQQNIRLLQEKLSRLLKAPKNTT